MNRKKLFNLFFLIAVFAVTWYTVFHDEDISSIFYWMTHVKERFLILGILIVPVFVCCESLIIKYLLGKLTIKIPFGHCVEYSFIGFFFSCITPSASGGQPAQIYQMQKDGINLTISSLVLLIVTIAYKFVLVFIGILCFIFARHWLDDYMGDTIFLFYLGIFLNVLCITGMLFLVFSKRLATNLLQKSAILLETCRILKKREDRMEQIENYMVSYHEAAKFIHENTLILLPVFFITLFQRIALFFVTYLVYLAFGLGGAKAATIIILQAVISLSVDMLPLPGGMGASESLFLVIFNRIFGERLILPAMLISRGISFYILLLVSALVTLYTRIAVRKKWRFHYDRIL